METTTTRKRVFFHVVRSAEAHDYIEKGVEANNLDEAILVAGRPDRKPAMIIPDGPPLYTTIEESL